MSWGTAYTYEGYLIRLGKNELREKLDDLKDDNDTLWNEILQRIAATPPVIIKDDAGNDYEYITWMSEHIKQLRTELEDNVSLMARIQDCLETMEEHPERVTEG